MFSCLPLSCSAFRHHWVHFHTTVEVSDTTHYIQLVSALQLLCPHKTQLTYGYCYNVEIQLTKAMDEGKPYKNKHISRLWSQVGKMHYIRSFKATCLFYFIQLVNWVRQAADVCKHVYVCMYVCMYVHTASTSIIIYHRKTTTLWYMFQQHNWCCKKIPH